jgi:hypothetical protein
MSKYLSSHFSSFDSKSAGIQQLLNCSIYRAEPVRLRQAGYAQSNTLIKFHFRPIKWSLIFKCIYNVFVLLPLVCCVGEFKSRPNHHRTGS